MIGLVSRERPPAPIGGRSAGECPWKVSFVGAGNWTGRRHGRFGACDGPAGWRDQSQEMAAFMETLFLSGAGRGWLPGGGFKEGKKRPVARSPVSSELYSSDPSPVARRLGTEMLSVKATRRAASWLDWCGRLEGPVPR